MTQTPVELAISAAWIIPVVPRERIYENCSLIVQQGKILDILPQGELFERYAPNEHIALADSALLPGLINTHGHAAMSLLRGFADDFALQPWLEEHIWPAENRWVNEDFVRDGTRLALSEMIRSGCSTFSDMYFFPELAAEVAHQSGIRAQIAFPIFDFPSSWGAGPEDYFEKGMRLHDDYRSNERINIAFGPHAPYTVGDEVLKKVATYAEELQSPIQIHVHETAKEVSDAIASKGQRPLQRLYELGILSPLTQCVHMTQIDEADIALLKQSGAHVVHCPKSNLKLASGVCPVTELIAEEINVALGTDGAASNNSLSMFSEINQAALLAKWQAQDATALSACEALEMATLSGAKALGIDDVCGSLEIGKSADICAVNLGAPEYQPVYNPISQIVYAGGSLRAEYLWVAGKALLYNGELSSQQLTMAVKQAQTWKDKISRD
jgi:5-methylthioadenosine/S-adenosylhomocysteine deaminase